MTVLISTASKTFHIRNETKIRDDLNVQQIYSEFRSEKENKTIM